MTLFIDKLKEISVFVYILLFLLVFNLIFNLNYDWYGISLIVRIYLFVFSFYLIFGFASLNLKELKKQYYDKFGAKGDIILFLEVRVLPFLLIYLITIVFTFIDYIRISDWPWRPLFELLDGRYSTIIIYSLFLFIILKLKKEPSIAIPTFLLVSVLYFILDKFLYSVSASGAANSSIKLLKLILFFSTISYEFYIKKLVSLVGSLVVSLFIFSTIISGYSYFYHFSDNIAYARKEAGMMLVGFGFSSAAKGLKNLVIKTYDYQLLSQLLMIAMKYDIEIEYNNEEWRKLLFSGSDNAVELISRYLIDKDIMLTYDEIVTFVEERSMDPDCKLDTAKHFLRISSRSMKDKEDDLITKIKDSSNNFKLWGIAVLSEIKSKKSIPLLLEFLTDVDLTISEGAYKALKRITGINPARKMKKRINDPDVIIKFKEYYREHHFDHKDS